ncbi:MAG: hypothetical protein JSW65_05725 [Candidatus Bipolaricaulota bacterium]|nr:MAG: hypothetical protein JSW65_05725 [Candidatus Bipolaricaulota bacterium]
MRYRALVAGVLAFALTAPALGGEMLERICNDGLGDPHNIGIVYMETHVGRLYAGTWNLVEGCLLYVSEDGETWRRVIEPGYGDKDNQAVIRMRSVGGFLYVGTWNNTTGGQLWRSSTPDTGAGWEPVMQDGFGNPANLAVGSIRPFGDLLYVGMFNPSQGQEMWRSAAGGGPGSFIKSFDRGLGIRGATDASSLLVWDGHLYLGTESAQPPHPGCDVWRTGGPDESGEETWVRVGEAGFGDAKSFNAFRMIAFKGQLYVGTWGFGASSFTTQLGPKGTTIWRTSGEGDGPYTDWEQVNEDGFGNVRYDSTLAMEIVGDTLYVGGFGDHGFLFATEDGTTWREITGEEFLEASEFGIHALGELNGNLYIGVQNWTKPAELWILRPEDGSES